MFIALLLAGYLLVLLVSHARKTNWSLFEALVISLVLGHVIVVPIALGIRERVDSEKLLALAVLSVTVAAAFAFGGVWMLRDLKIVREQRTGVRLVYIAAGLLFIPSLLAIPYNLVLGWLIWLPVFQMEQRAAKQAAVDLETLRQQELLADFAAAPTPHPAAPAEAI